MAPARLRGSLSGINQTMIVSGMLISYIDYILKDLPENMSWRLMLGLAAVPAIILFLGVLKLRNPVSIKANQLEKPVKFYLLFVNQMKLTVS